MSDANNANNSHDVGPTHPPSTENEPSSSPSSPAPAHPTTPRCSQRPNPLAASLRFLRRRTREHYENCTLAELSGALGDLGTFIPLTVALARERKIALAPALFWAGVSNVATGYAWDVPMCVQPMKSIAAVALTDGGGEGGFDALAVTTAGVLTGAAVLVLGAAGLMEVVNAIVPLAVVCGLQVGVGLRLASKGIQDIQRLSWGGGYDCIGLAVACALLSMFWLRDSGNGMIEKKVDRRVGEGGREEEGQEAEEGSTKNSLTHNCHGDGLAGTSANSVAASSVGEDCCRMEDDAVMEMGNLRNSPRSDTTTTTQLQQPCSTRSTAVHASATFSNLSAPSPASSQSPTPVSSWRTQLLKRACCCLDPVPRTPHPVGIYLFLIGALFAAVTLATAGPDAGYDLPLRLFGAPVVVNALAGAAPSDWRRGFLQGTLPQLPLTALNSVISVCCLAHALYPDQRRPSLVRAGRTDAVVTRREVAVSVGLLNLLLCPLGSAPNCHGAGGLAGQHRFGARHGTAVVLLGAGKALLAVFAGGSALTLLDALPVAVLGIMLAIAGLELVGTGVGALFERVRREEEETRSRLEADTPPCPGKGTIERGAGRVIVNSKAILRKNVLVAMVTAVVILALQKTHYGAISGCVVHMVYGDGSRQFLHWAREKKWRKNSRAAAEEDERIR